MHVPWNTWVLIVPALPPVCVYWVLIYTLQVPVCLEWPFTPPALGPARSVITTAISYPILLCLRFYGYKCLTVMCKCYLATCWIYTTGNKKKYWLVVFIVRGVAQTSYILFLQKGLPTSTSLISQNPSPTCSPIPALPPPSSTDKGEGL